VAIIIGEVMDEEGGDEREGLTRPYSQESGGRYLEPIYSDPLARGVLRVFLCHSSTDKPAVRSLYERLQSSGVDPWLDEVNILPGQDWDLEIRKAIRACHIVLVCISKSSTAKVGYIQKEIRYVLDVADEQPDGTIFLIPVRLEECDVPERLRRLQWVDLYEQYGYQRMILALNTQAQRLRLSLFSDVERRVVRTSLTPEGYGGLSLKARYNWTLDSIMWALPGEPAPEDEQIMASNLIGNLDEQRKLEELLARRNGVKIGADSVGEQRPFSELHLIATGRRDSPILITGMGANVIKRERPISGTLIFGPPEGAGDNIEIGFDLDSLVPIAQALNNDMHLAGPFFAKRNVSLTNGEHAVFSMRAFTGRYYCEWELVVEAFIDDKLQILSLRDGTQPFRTTAFADSYQTIYKFDFMGSGFVRLPPGATLHGQHPGGYSGPKVAQSP
jgi:hypothetical protein